MKLKVCGMTQEKNIQEVLWLAPDFIGFIFYKKSPRFVNDLKPAFVHDLEGAVKVGVFVNATFEDIVATVESYGLDMVQLHGEEPLSLIQQLKKEGISIIKVFRVLDELPNELDDYAPYSDLFLFDTRSYKFGGSGKQFDWSILSKVNHPFLLSGGIGMDDLKEIKKMKLRYLIGLDINSKVESSPGFKDIGKVKSVKTLL